MRAPLAVNEIEDLYRRYGPMVLRRCARLLGSEQEAEDAMQDVFVQTLEKKQNLHGQFPSSLLWRMATNVCLNRLRSRTRHPTSPEDTLLQEIASVDEPTFELRNWLDHLFGGSPPSTRMMAVLHWVDGMTLEQVAHETGLSVSGVRKRLRTLQASVRTLETHV